MSQRLKKSAYQMVCQNCPDFMYNYETMKEIWMKTCKDRGSQYRERARYFFKHCLGRYLKHIVFVVAYSNDHNAGIFVDHKMYKYLKEKVDKAVEIAEKIPDISPSKLSKKNPQIMRMFKSLKDFNLCTDQLRQKNRAIAKQRHANGIYTLSKIVSTVDSKETIFLALSGEISERNPRKILQIGFAVFELQIKTEPHECYHYIVRENVTEESNDLSNFFRKFGETKALQLADILNALQDRVSQAHFLITHSMSSAEVKTFLSKHGVKTDGKEIIDTLTLHFTICPDSRKQNSMEEMLTELGIPFDHYGLQNAGCNAVYLAQIFRALLSREISHEC